MTAAAVASACRAAGVDPAQLLGTSPVGGGCINEGVVLRTTSGNYFLKWNARAGHRFFRVEAEGLAALAATGAVTTPYVVARSSRDDAVPWLLLEWIEGATPDAGGWRRLGREVAALHRWQGAGPGYGWHSDNVIGSLPQPNHRTDDWGDFWTEQRIRPLARELRAGGVLSVRELDAVEQAAGLAGDLMDPAAKADGPSLLHGDLWSGNVLFGRRGVPVLIDPAVYVGHREVDLAMCRLFGGFPAAFYDAYDDAWPLHPGHKRRRHAYQLYPLLVHARLFGGGYVASVMRAAKAILAASS